MFGLLTAFLNMAIWVERSSWKLTARLVSSPAQRGSDGASGWETRQVAASGWTRCSARVVACALPEDNCHCRTRYAEPAVPSTSGGRQQPDQTSMQAQQ